MPISTTKSSDVDVLIVGAGPAGLMACNALARAGITVRIVDKRPVKVTAGQADGIQPRTIEVLQSYGLADRLLAEANQMHQVVSAFSSDTVRETAEARIEAFYNPNPVTGGIELTDRTPDVQDESTPYPFEATLHQGAIEDIFLDSMKKYGVEVSRPVAPASIQISQQKKDSGNPDARPVRVILKRLDALEGQTDTEIVHAKYMIGADGAHSWVRKALNIDMEGEQTDYVWGVVDMIPDTDFPDIRNKSAIHSNNGSCMIIPREGDKIRLYIQLGSREAIDATNRVDKDQMGPEKLLNVARKSLVPYNIRQPKSIDWWTIYRILVGQRVASRYSAHDRVFIAGDACHTHSPKAGQGMNASMNDTHNLAWKLIHVIRGWAKPSLLQTYELERRKYAQDLINFDKKFAKMFSGKIDDTLDGISAQDFTNAFHTFGGFTSGIGIQYQESTIICSRHQGLAPGLVIGKRLPAQRLSRSADGRPFELQELLPSDTRFKILVFTGDLLDRNQRGKVNRFATDMDANHRFLKRKSPGGDIFTMFHILTITSIRGDLHYTELPELFRSHWSNVYVDKQSRTRGGDAYTNYCIGPAGAIVVVRPDGYIGTIGPFDQTTYLDEYFDGFMGQ